MGDLTANLSRHEFACKNEHGEPCSCGLDTADFDTVMIAQAMRDAFGKMTITSACRCLRQNTRVGGSPGSQHLALRAFDAVFEKGTPKEWAKLADKLGATGIGVYSNWIHVDTRTGPKARWGDT